MKVVLVSLFDAHNFAVRVLKRVLSDSGYDTRLVFYKSHYGEKKSTDREIKNLAESINCIQPDVVGFTIRSTFYPEFKRIAPLINARIIVGGQHPTVCPEDFDGYTVCVGEGEDVICDIVEGKDGIVYGGMAKDVNTIPVAMPSNEKKMSVMTARGCFFNCTFCYNSLQRKIIDGWKVRRRDPDNVMREVHDLITTCPNLEEIVFSDNIFVWGYDWLREFFKNFKKTGLKFRCFGHFGMVPGRSLRLIKDSGCHIITVGIQGNERVRYKYYNKEIPDSIIVRDSNNIASLGIFGRYDIITNNPYETEEDRKSLDGLIGELKRPFMIRKFPLLHNPKTDFTKRCLKDKLITKNDVQGIATNAYKKWGEFISYDN